MSRSSSSNTSASNRFSGGLSSTTTATSPSRSRCTGPVVEVMPRSCQPGGQPSPRPPSRCTCTWCDRLAGLGAGVGHQPVARLVAVPLHQPLPAGHRVGGGDHLGEQRGVGGGQRDDVAVVVLGDHQHVRGRLRVDVAEGQHPVRLGDDRGRHLPGDHAAEQAVRHGRRPYAGAPAGRAVRSSGCGRRARPGPRHPRSRCAAPPGPAGRRRRRPPGRPALAVGEAALRADDDGDRAAARDVDRGQRPAAPARAAPARVGLGEQPGHLAGGHRRGHLGHPRPAGLLGGLPGGGPPLRQPLVHAVLAPAGHAARGRPRHDRVDAELGGQLDRQRPRSPLGSACTSTNSRVGRRHLVAGLDPHAQPLGPGGRAPRRRPRCRGRRRAHQLAAASRRTSTACRPPRRRDEHGPGRQRVDQEQRGAVEIGDAVAGSAHRPLNASRMRENNPPCASRWRLGLVLAAQRRQLAQQLLLLGVQPGRRHAPRRARAGRRGRCRAAAARPARAG